MQPRQNTALALSTYKQNGEYEQTLIQRDQTLEGPKHVSYRHKTWNYALISIRVADVLSQASLKSTTGLQGTKVAQKCKWQENAQEQEGGRKDGGGGKGEAERKAKKAVKPVFWQCQPRSQNSTQFLTEFSPDALAAARLATSEEPALVARPKPVRAANKEPRTAAAAEFWSGHFLDLCL